MRRLLFSVLVIAGIFLFQGCTVQQHATTIEPDKDNTCIIRMVIQIGIDGTDADVVAVRDQLEACYAKECFVPCEGDGSKGCKTMINVIVKKWSDLGEKEREAFHHITMVDNDGLPSNAYIGKPNAGASSGTWRRNEPPRTYCHEVLHLCGLPDKYCSRLYNAVDSTVVVEVSCAPPPDPANGNCCTPTVRNTRCGQPCPGFEHDIMASLEPELSCSNILDVLKGAGFDKCPAACCGSNTAYHPTDYIFVGPGYIDFGDKSTKFGGIGITTEYNKVIKPNLGLTLDGGYYTNSKTDTYFKQTNNLLNITAGITYQPDKVFKSQPRLSLSTHLLAGISSWMQKSTLMSNGNSTKNNKTSLNLNLGAALNYNLDKNFSLRLLQADYTPTFFYSTMQHNLRLSLGICYNFKSR